MPEKGLDIDRKLYFAQTTDQTNGVIPQIRVHGGSKKIAIKRRRTISCFKRKAWRLCRLNGSKTRNLSKPSLPLFSSSSSLKIFPTGKPSRRVSRKICCWCYTRLLPGAASFSQMGILPVQCWIITTHAKSSIKGLSESGQGKKARSIKAT